MPLDTDHNLKGLIDMATDYDYLTFDERDERDERVAEDLRELLWDLPARPGTLR